MLPFLTILIMLMLAYAHSRQGLFTGATFFVNVILAGVLAYHVWEPLAMELDELFADDLLAGYEDAFALTIPFAFFLVLLRVATNKLATQPFDFPGYVQQLGGGFFGLMTGYLLAGFLICVLQTLPGHLNLVIKPRGDGETSLRRFLQPDRAWLVLMRHDGERKTPLNFP